MSSDVDLHITPVSQPRYAALSLSVKSTSATGILLHSVVNKPSLLCCSTLIKSYHPRTHLKFHKPSLPLVCASTQPRTFNQLFTLSSSSLGEVCSDQLALDNSPRFHRHEQSTVTPHRHKGQYSSHEVAITTSFRPRPPCWTVEILSAPHVYITL